MHPKKNLGQNFLTSEPAIYKIIQAGKISVGETVLEVGPGRGVLTKAMLSAGARVIAVEKDHDLLNVLNVTFSAEIANKRLTILENDILKIEPENLGLKAGKYKLIANIPYNITGQLIRKFLSATSQPSLMVLLLQREVVDRIIANNAKESLLSLSVKTYGQVRKITTVNRGSFYPSPNVDSAVIAIENISKNFYKEISEENFFKTIKAGFAHKRKILVSNLENLASKEKILATLIENKISEKARAEDITLEQWKKIAASIFKN